MEGNGVYFVIDNQSRRYALSNSCYKLIFAYFILYFHAKLGFLFWRIVIFLWLEQNHGWSIVDHLGIRKVAEGFTILVQPFVHLTLLR